MNSGTAVSPLRVNAPPALSMNEAELFAVLRSSLYPGAKDESIKLVVGYCRAAGLDPMQKPCHIVPMWDKNAGAMRDVVMPGVGLYRTQAARTGQFAGSTEPEFGPDKTETIDGVSVTYPEWCRVTVKRQLPSGYIAEFPSIEFWKENYAVKGGKEKSIAPNAMWLRRPRGQLAKCAEAQALRKAFPEIGAQPTAEEMEGKDLDAGAGVTIDTASGALVDGSKAGAGKPAAATAKEPYPADKFDANFPSWKALVETGTKTPQQILATLESKAMLLDGQRKRISDLKPKAADPASAAREPGSDEGNES